MSASKDKKLRMEARNAPDAAAKSPVTEQEKARRKYKITVSVISIVLVIFILAVIFLSSSAMYNKYTSVKIGDEKFTACDYAFYYGIVYQQYYQMLVNYYGSANVDTSLIPSASALKPDVLDLMQSTAVLHHEAETASYSMDEDAQQQVETYVASAQTAADQYTSGDVSDFLVKNYCKGMTTDKYRECVEYYVYATSYGMSVYNSYTYTTADLDAYYATRADELDKFTYDWFLMNNDDYDGNAEKTANEFQAKLEDGETFSAVAYEYATDEKKANYDSGSTTTTTLSGENLNDLFKSWLTDASRKAGDTAVFTTDTGAYVLQFRDRDNNAYNLVNFRHILVKPDEVKKDDYATDAEYQTAVDEADERAKEEADMYYALWKEDATEENFGKLAAEYSDDSAENGLCENVYKGQMVTEMNDWIFDPARKSGDTSIVKTTYGYHIVYFIGESDTRYCDTLAENDKRDEDYNNWEAECKGDGYAVSTNLIFNLTSKA